MDSRTEMQDGFAFRAQEGPGDEANPSVDYLRALKRGAGQPALENVPTKATGSDSGLTPPADKRRAPRYKCEGSAEFRTEGVDVRTWARVTDLSRNGCYVEMQATSPLNTPVVMTLDVNGIRVRVKGTVRASYPLLGMGIGFTEISEEEQTRLDELLRQLAGGAAVPAFDAEATPARSSAHNLLMILDPGAALNALARFFESNRVLSREEFSELITKSQQRSRGAGQ